MRTSICDRVAAVVAFIAVAAVGFPTSGHAQTAYLDFDDLTDELRSIDGASDAVALHSIGRSHEGREIWLLEIGGTGGAPLDERPAVLVLANLEANHLVGSANAVAIARYLAENAADPSVRRVLDEQAVYIVPRVNPDGAEAVLAGESDRRRNARPYDDDNDGRIDEDAPRDLNGDGLVTVMRVPDPAGELTTDPADPRLLRRANPARGERGEYIIYWEGTDADGDGFIGEDGPGGVDLNRNFQHTYPYWQRDAGPHMVSEPESRALMDFVVSHRNIAAILAFGLTDNLVTPPDLRGELASERTPSLSAFADAANDALWEMGVFGGVATYEEDAPDLRGAQLGRDNNPQSGRRPAETVDGADVEYFGIVSEAYRDLTGIARVPMHRAPEGAFFEYGYFQFGVPSFSTTGWGVPEPPGGGSGDAALVGSLEAGGVDAFVDWTPYDHPEFGTVEIGGIRPGAAVNPAPAQVPARGRAHGEFVVRLAGMLPRVRIVETDVTPHGGGIYTVEAAIENEGYFPTALQHGVVARSVDPVTVQVGVAPEAVISGDPKTARVNRLEGSGSRERFLWLVQGRPGQTIEIRSRAQKGGTHAVTVTLP